MRSRCLITSTVVALLLTACSDIKEPSDANFRTAINRYLAKHGEACTGIGRQFPVDISDAEQTLHSDAASQMAVLEQADWCIRAIRLRSFMGCWMPCAAPPHHNL